MTMTVLTNERMRMKNQKRNQKTMKSRMEQMMMFTLKRRKMMSKRKLR